MQAGWGTGLIEVYIQVLERIPLILVPVLLRFLSSTHHSSAFIVVLHQIPPRVQNHDDNEGVLQQGPPGGKQETVRRFLQCTHRPLDSGKGRPLDLLAVGTTRAASQVEGFEGWEDARIIRRVFSFCGDRKGCA